MEEYRKNLLMGFGFGMLGMYSAYSIQNISTPPFAVILLISGYALLSMIIMVYD
jgi:hypothetical protein